MWRPSVNRARCKMAYRKLTRLVVRAFLAVCVLVFSPHPAAIAQTGRSTSSSSRPLPAPASPPVAPVRPVTDNYFGTKVVDPYRYMENLKDPKVAAWFKGQNAYTRAVLAKIPGRDGLLARIKELDQSTPERVSDVRLIP